MTSYRFFFIEEIEITINKRKLHIENSFSIHIPDIVQLFKKVLVDVIMANVFLIYIDVNIYILSA